MYSDRELRIAELNAAGMHDQEIADMLRISRMTVFRIRKAMKLPPVKKAANNKAIYRIYDAATNALLYHGTSTEVAAQMGLSCVEHLYSILSRDRKAGESKYIIVKEQQDGSN